MNTTGVDHAEVVPEPSVCFFFLGMQTRQPRKCSTSTWIQRGAGENSLELLRRLVIKMVSSRLATIKARQSEKKTSGGKTQDRQTLISNVHLWKSNFCPQHHSGRPQISTMEGLCSNMALNFLSLTWRLTEFFSLTISANHLHAEAHCFHPLKMEEWSISTV